MMYSPYCQESMVPVLADGIYTISSVGILHCESVILAEGGVKYLVDLETSAYCVSDVVAIKY